MNYKLAKKLKDAGFPQSGTDWLMEYEGIDGNTYYQEICDYGTCRSEGQAPEYKKCVYLPTLEELIEACGERFGFLLLNPENGMWLARVRGIEPIHPEFSGHRHYNEPDEAVANLWLALHTEHPHTEV